MQKGKNNSFRAIVLGFLQMSIQNQLIMNCALS